MFAPLLRLAGTVSSKSSSRSDEDWYSGYKKKERSIFRKCDTEAGTHRHVACTWFQMSLVNGDAEDCQCSDFKFGAVNNHQEKEAADVGTQAGGQAATFEL